MVYLAPRVGISRGLVIRKNPATLQAKEETKIVLVKDIVFLMPQQ